MLHCGCAFCVFSFLFFFFLMMRRPPKSPLFPYPPPFRSQAREYHFVRAFGEARLGVHAEPSRSEEHTSELQSPYVISYALFFLKKKNTNRWCCTASCLSCTSQRRPRSPRM